MIKMPAHDVILIRIFLLLNGVIKNQQAIIPFNLTHGWLDLAP